MKPFQHADTILVLGFVAGLFLIDPHFLGQPPFWDGILGFFREGFWLLDNHWNVSRFLFEEPGYAAGGARTYTISVYPSLIALLFLALPTATSVFVVLHLFTLLCAVSLLVVFRRTLCSLGASERESVLGSAVLAMSPMFLSQSMALNVELACGLSLLLLGRCLERDAWRTGLAVLWIGFLLKATVAVAGAAAGIFIMTRALIEHRPLRRAAGVALLFLGPCLVYLLYAHAEQNVFFQGGSDGRFEFARLLDPMSFLERLFVGGWKAQDRLSPLLFLISVVSFVALLVIEGALVISRIASKTVMRPLPPCVLYAVTASAVYHLATSFFTNPLPRYYMVVYPLYLLFLYWILIQLPRRFTAGVLLTLCAALAFNFNGRLYRFTDAFPPESNDGYFAERTILGQRVVERDKVVAQLLYDEYRRALIVAPWPYSIVLRDPRYGYVPAPLNVHEYSTKRAIPPATAAAQQTVVLDANNCFAPQDGFYRAFTKGQAGRDTLTFAVGDSARITLSVPSPQGAE